MIEPWPRATRSSPRAACSAGSRKIGESFLTVEIANGVEMQVQRAAVVQVLPKGTFK